MKHLDAQALSALTAKEPEAVAYFREHLASPCDTCEEFLAQSTTDGLDGQVDALLLALAPRSAAALDEVGWMRLKRRLRTSSHTATLGGRGRGAGGLSAGGGGGAAAGEDAGAGAALEWGEGLQPDRPGAGGGGSGRGWTAAAAGSGGRGALGGCAPAALPRHRGRQRPALPADRRPGAPSCSAASSWRPGRMTSRALRAWPG